LLFELHSVRHLFDEAQIFAKWIYLYFSIRSINLLIHLRLFAFLQGFFDSLVKLFLRKVAGVLLTVDEYWDKIAGQQTVEPHFFTVFWLFIDVDFLVDDAVPEVFNCLADSFKLTEREGTAGRVEDLNVHGVLQEFTIGSLKRARALLNRIVCVNFWLPSKHACALLTLLRTRSQASIQAQRYRTNSCQFPEFSNTLARARRCSSISQDF